MYAGCRSLWCMHTYTCMNVYVFMCMQAAGQRSVYIHTLIINVCTYLCICRLQVNAVYTYTYLFIYAYVLMCTQAAGQRCVRIHTLIHMNTYLCVCRLQVNAGSFRDSEIVVMLGENGTGKTTFIKMLAGLLLSDEEEKGHKLVEKFKYTQNTYVYIEYIYIEYVRNIYIIYIEYISNCWLVSSCQAKRRRATCSSKNSSMSLK